jgi:hypothetical protein
MHRQLRCVKWMIMLAAVWTSSFVFSVALGQSRKDVAGQKKTGPAETTTADSSAPSSHHLSARQSMLASRQTSRQRWSYGALGGIENLKVQQTASGTLLRFGYRVADANKAKALNDKKANPYMVDQKTGAVLQISEAKNLGQLRQTDVPVKGHEYWMIFSNKGVVKPGSRVDVVIGNLRFNGLIVQ